MTTHTCLVCGAPADNLVYGGKTHVGEDWVINRVWMCNEHEAVDRMERAEKART